MPLEVEDEARLAYLLPMREPVPITDIALGKSKSEIK